MEQKLKIETNGKYKNISLKANPMKNREGIDDGNYIVVEKLYPNGKEISQATYTIYSCGVRYLGEEVSFILNEREYELFQQYEVGDNVRITLKKETFINKKTGGESLIKKLYFEKVN